MEMLNKLDPSWHDDSHASNQPSTSVADDEVEPDARDEERTIVSCTPDGDVTSRPSFNSSPSLPSWLNKTTAEGM